MNNDSVSIRTIEPRDNAAIAGIIRKTLEEFGANHPGTVYFDNSTDALFELFTSTPRARYFVAERSNLLLGDGGIFPTAGLPPDTCELVKMYLSPEARGLGLARQIIDLCESAARAFEFSNIYLESMPELGQALAVYEHLGFQYLSGPMGNTGHFGCERWMLKRLS